MSGLVVVALLCGCLGSPVAEEVGAEAARAVDLRCGGAVSGRRFVASITDHFSSGELPGTHTFRSDVDQWVTFTASADYEEDFGLYFGASDPTGGRPQYDTHSRGNRAQIRRWVDAGTTVNMRTQVYDPKVRDGTDLSNGRHRYVDRYKEVPSGSTYTIRATCEGPIVCGPVEALGLCRRRSTCMDGVATPGLCMTAPGDVQCCLPVPSPVVEPPIEATPFACEASLGALDGCDCGCGQDPDCEPVCDSCPAAACDYCWDATGALLPDCSSGDGGAPPPGA